jgi:Cu/Ag efflux protein CusF
MKRLIVPVIMSLVLSGLALTVTAADNAPAEAPAKAKKAGSIPLRGTVSAVDAAAKTITLKGAQKDRVFAVTTETTIMKNGAAATVNDVAAGDYVTGAYMENNGKMELRSLKVGQPPKKKEK